MQKGRKQQTVHWEIQELGPVQFDLIDKFDMFDNPHDEDKTEEELEPIRELYLVSDRNHSLIILMTIG